MRVRERPEPEAHVSGEQEAHERLDPPPERGDGDRRVGHRARAARVAEQVRQPRGLRQRHPRERDRLRVLDVVDLGGQERQLPRDDHQGVAEIVDDPGEHLAAALVRHGRAQPLFGLHRLRHVLLDADEVRDRPELVADRRDRHARPVVGAVLASVRQHHVAARALRERAAHHVPRAPIVDGGREHARVLAEHVRDRVPRQPFGGLAREDERHVGEPGVRRQQRDARPREPALDQAEAIGEPGLRPDRVGAEQHRGDLAVDRERRELEREQERLAVRVPELQREGAPLAAERGLDAALEAGLEARRGRRPDVVAHAQRATDGLLGVGPGARVHRDHAVPAIQDGGVLLHRLERGEHRAIDERGRRWRLDVGRASRSIHGAARPARVPEGGRRPHDPLARLPQIAGRGPSLASPQRLRGGAFRGPGRDREQRADASSERVVLRDPEEALRRARPARDPVRVVHQHHGLAGRLLQRARERLVAARRRRRGGGGHGGPPWRVRGRGFPYSPVCTNGSLSIATNAGCRASGVCDPGRRRSLRHVVARTRCAASSSTDGVSGPTDVDVRGRGRRSVEQL